MVKADCIGKIGFRFLHSGVNRQKTLSPFFCHLSGDMVLEGTFSPT